MKLVRILSQESGVFQELDWDYICSVDTATKAFMWDSLGSLGLLLEVRVFI